MRAVRGRLPALMAGIVAALLPALLWSSAARANTLLPPDPDVAIGQEISFAGFVDQNGDPLPTPSADARPWIVSPMYARCPTTCSVITAALKAALARSGLQPSEYRVLSFSFDPRETDASLAEFRARMQLPPEWVTLRASDPAALERTLRRLDFRTLELYGGRFEHPNLVAVLDPSRRVVDFVYGVNPSPSALARAAARARNGASVLDRWRPYSFFFAAVGLLASSAVFHSLLRHRRRRLAIPYTGTVLGDRGDGERAARSDI
jgi:cytochrome oxidase Cu insertion factor (SCO1/SenC/PrrC family)